MMKRFAKVCNIVNQLTKVAKLSTTTQTLRGCSNIFIAKPMNSATEILSSSLRLISASF